MYRHRKTEKSPQKLAHGNVKETIIGTNIEVVSDELVDSDKKGYFIFWLSIPGKGYRAYVKFVEINS